MKIIKPPSTLPVIRRKGVVPYSMFLAGSIEMGGAEDWQTSLTNYISVPENNVKCDYIFNPRRDDWNTALYENKEVLYEQASWEMTALDIAQVIIMYFDPNTKSPISFLELGLHAASGKMIVCCPNGFWRKDNVQIVCERFGIPLYSEKPTDSLCILRIKDMLLSKNL